MAWYWAVSIVAAWITLTYLWGLFGVNLLVRLTEGDLGFAEFYFWVGLVCCGLSWPVIALKYDIGVSWYWWLLMFDVIGIPWAIMVTVDNIHDRGYTYGSPGVKARIGWSIWWLLASFFWPLQWMGEYVAFD